MDFRVWIDASAENTAMKFLAGIQNRLENPRDLMNGIAILMRRSFAKNFEEQGRPAQWAPLTPKYLERKRAAFFAAEGRVRGRNARQQRVRVGRGHIGVVGSMPGILVFTGATKDAVTRRNNQGNIHRLSADGKTLTVGAGMIYQPDSGKSLPLAYWHDQGRGHNPVRKIFVLQPDDWTDIVKLSYAYMLTGDIGAFTKPGRDDE